MHDDATVWIFNGNGGHFPAGVFTNREDAEAWIRKHALSGVLTRYPVDTGAYDWAISNGHFSPKKPEHTCAQFIQRFGCATFEHYHFEQGNPA